MIGLTSSVAQVTCTGFSPLFTAPKDSSPSSVGSAVNQVSSCWEVSNPTPCFPTSLSWIRGVATLRTRCLFARLLNRPTPHLRPRNVELLNQFRRKYARKLEVPRAFYRPDRQLRLSDIKMARGANWNIYSVPSNLRPGIVRNRETAF